MDNRHDDIQEEVLAGQIPEYKEETTVNDEISTESLIGKKLSFDVASMHTVDKTGIAEFEEKAGVTRLGENVKDRAEVRDGWMPIDRRLLGERDKFYPAEWTFMVRPATVEAIRNWSMLDESNANSIDDVFNEILKHCLTIKTPYGPQTWQSINNWDRFFFVLVIREFTFANGENNIEFFEDCENCDASTRFTLESQALMYDLPDESVLQYFDCETRTWFINPVDFGVDYPDEIKLYVPTIERDANIKAWLISEYQENDKKKFDNVFIKFLPWLVPKISKDASAAKMQIRKAEMMFKGWDTEMFSFMNDVIKNIAVTPSTSISAICPSCGEEVTTRLRFPDGVGSLFNVVNRRSKFGTK